MYKIDKEIMTNNNLDKPNKDVLEKAKSIMPEKKVRWNINARQITALATSLVIIIVMIVCIPFMLPANNGNKIIPNSELSIKFIESIEDFNKANDLNILYFETSEQVMVYAYQGIDIFVEEKCVVDGLNVMLLVKVNNNCNDISFEKETEYVELLNYANEYIISGTMVYVSKTSKIVFMSFTKDSYRYYISLLNDKNDDTWITILEKFLN